MLDVPANNEAAYLRGAIVSFEKLNRLFENVPCLCAFFAYACVLVPFMREKLVKVRWFAKKKKCYDIFVIVGTNVGQLWKERSIYNLIY